jgi:phage N-6-adenine-methyltransferase
MAAAKIANLPVGGRGANQYGSNCSLLSSCSKMSSCSKVSTLATSQADASKALKVSRTSVQNAKAVLDHGTPELIAAVERGMIPVTKAAEISRMKDSVQQNKTITKLTEKPHVSHNSGNNEWYTPPEIIEAARATMGRIDCDPASSELANKTVKAKKYYTAEQNGLERKWGEKVWLNPPYSQPAINHFADALSQRVKDKEIKEACILVNNATDAAWCQKILMLGSCVCFLRGRVKFIDMEGCATGAPLQGQIVVYIGENIDDFKANFTSMGVILFYME